MTTTQRKIPIIAVFGSTNEEARQLATFIGAEVVRQHMILLTGGEGNNGKGVKEWAIDGAKNARSKSCLGAWIGVPNDASKRKFDPHPDDMSCRIYTGLEDKRNYLEAHLCDAAIALYGGDGTTSEVTFCLSLQKPVVLIGKWSTEYPPDNPATLEKLITSSFKRMMGDKSGNPILDQLLDKQTIRARLQSAPKARKDYLMPLDTDRPRVAADAVDDILSFLKQSPETSVQGTFPELAGSEYGDIKDKYNSWLRRIEDRLIAI